MELLIATTHSGKFREIRLALSDLSVNCLSLNDFPKHPVVAEDGWTFEENALKKARTIGRWSGKMTLADDSGIVVPALGGRPGIHSARYSGPGSTDQENLQKLIGEVRGLPDSERGAFYVCVLVVVLPTGEEWTFTGRCDGVLLAEPRGMGGFGYDPVFFLPALGKTLAEIPLTEKNTLSHRGKALRELKNKLRMTLPKK